MPCRVEGSAGRAPIDPAILMSLWLYAVLDGQQLMRDAQAQVEALKLEVADEPGAGTRRVRAARQRAASEREQRIDLALKAMDEIDKSLSGENKKARADRAPADTVQDEPARIEDAPDRQPADGQAAGKQTAEGQTKRGQASQEAEGAAREHHRRRGAGDEDGRWGCGQARAYRTA